MPGWVEAYVRKRPEDDPNAAFEPVTSRDEALIAAAETMTNDNTDMAVEEIDATATAEGRFRIWQNQTYEDLTDGVWGFPGGYPTRHEIHAPNLPS